MAALPPVTSPNQTRQGRSKSSTKRAVSRGLSEPPMSKSQELAQRKSRVLTAKRIPIFVKSPNDPENALPRPLPQGIAYAANFTTFSYDDLISHGVLGNDDRGAVHLSADQVGLLFRAKCHDQLLEPTRHRQARFLELVSRTCSSTTLSLRDAGLAVASSRAISEILSTNQHYSVLDLTSNSLGDAGGLQLAALLARTSTLVGCVLRSNHIGPVGGEALARALVANSTLTSLDLGGETGANRNHLGNRGAAAFGAALRMNRTLAILSLASNGLGPDGVALLSEGVKGNGTLTDVDLSSNNLSAVGMSSLAEALCVQGTAVERLFLRRNAIGDKGGAVVAQMLSAPHPPAAHLVFLDLSQNGIGRGGALALASALKDSPSLQTLILDQNNVGEDGGVHIAAALAENTRLSTLSMRECGVEGAAGAGFGAALSHNSTLTKLDLAGNTLREEGGTALVSALGAPNSKLVSLDLSNNSLGDECGAALASALSSAHTLQRVSVRGNSFRECGTAFADALRANSNVLAFDCTHNTLSYKAVVAVEVALSRNKAWRKATVGERIGKQIELLRADEDALLQVEEAIEDERRSREQLKERVTLKGEQTRRAHLTWRQSLSELEAELEAARTARERDEAACAELSEEVAAYKQKAEAQTGALTKSIESAQEESSMCLRQLKMIQKQIAQLAERESDTVDPLKRTLEEEETERDAAKKKAQHEADRLVGFEFRIAELQRRLAQLKDDERKASRPATKKKK